jgi:hypothetical protein
MGATKVVPEGRISPASEERGLWTDAPLKQIVDFGGEPHRAYRA